MWNLIRLALLACLPVVAADLKITFIDVEGGQATLIVSPGGESLLVDAGWPGYEGRDADRIVAAAKKAGLSQIDYVLVTHHHIDHVGGVAPLVAKFPVKAFIDHGDNTETGRGADRLTTSYKEVLAGGAKRITVKPGDRIPLKGLDIDVVSARGELLAQPMKGAGKPNPGCAAVQPKQDDATENARSVGFVLRYGKFSFVDLADLTWNKELALVCPESRIGQASVYLVSHHGMDISNAPPVLSAVRPRVAISNVGERKGGSPAAWQVIRKSEGLEDFWQLHFAQAGGAEANVAPDFIANPETPCKGHNIVLTAKSNGSFTVTNERNNFSKTYK